MIKVLRLPWSISTVDRSSLKQLTFACGRFLQDLLYGGYFLFVSLFCFSALNSYTYIFLIKAPPYLWLVWFVGHASTLYWAAMAAGVGARWKKRRRTFFVALWGVQAAVGILFTVRHLALTITNDRSAFNWAVALLLPALLVFGADVLAETTNPTEESGSEFPYPQAAYVAVTAAILSIAATLLRDHFRSIPFAFHQREADAALIAVAEYVWLALLVVSLVNILQRVATERIRRTCPIRSWTVLLLVFVVIQVSLLRFLETTLSIKGWPINIYATCVAAFVSVWGNVLWTSVSAQGTLVEHGRLCVLRGRLRLILSGISILALLLPTYLGYGDWNGLISGTFYLFYWVLLSLVLFTLFPRRANYSVPGIVAVLVICGSLCFAMHATAFIWAKPLGATDHEVDLALQDMRQNDEGWQIVEKVFRYKADQSCGDLCRTLRQYSNLPNAQVREPLRLVDDLRPASEERPNIFIFVIDSLRPDYLGAYNLAADFTPNIDMLANDSVVMHNAFTQYAGTSLSEPTIWSGALLLHAHYMRPFENVNSLRTLASNDGYNVAVSYDTILRRIMPRKDDLTKFDEGKEVPQFEISSTLQQLKKWMDGRLGNDQPILFYAQPMNVHELAKNNLPSQSAQNWRSRKGFNNRVAFRLHQADESLGEFFRYLKERGLYDKSIIIVTSDHGDAYANLPGFGLQRKNHSTIIFPEVMRVPLIVHLPRQMRSKLVWDENRVATLTDITPSLYYLLGHRPVKQNPIFGQPLFLHSVAELKSYHRDHLLLASDAAADYGILSGDGRFLYAVYDSPARSMLFDLKYDPVGTHNIVTDETAQHFDQQIVNDLQTITKFYGYRPTGGKSTGFVWDAVGNSR